MSEFMAVFLCLVVRFSFHFPVWFQLDWGHETLKQPEVFCSIFPSKKKKKYASLHLFVGIDLVRLLFVIKQ